MRDFKEHLDALEKINERYTEEERILKMLEETAELMLAITKYVQETDEVNKGLHRMIAIGEIADVQIMLLHIMKKFGCSNEVDEMIDYKIKRQKEREGI